MVRMRNISYLLDEVAELLGLSRKKFRYNLVRFCKANKNEILTVHGNVL